MINSGWIGLKAKRQALAKDDQISIFEVPLITKAQEFIVELGWQVGEGIEGQVFFQSHQLFL